ncbi:hypothetical protein RFI_36408, partial [Reticulomyxa filosa]
IRFSGELNANLDELKVNLVPFPRLHFMTTGMSPIVSKMDLITTPNDVQTITDECFKPTNWLLHYDSFDPVEDQYLSIVLNYRGNVSSKEANTAVQLLEKRSQIGLNDVPAAILEQDDIAAFSKNAAVIANNTAISRLFSERISRKFDLMMTQQAYTQWYHGEGMSGGDFPEAREDVGFLEKDYLDVLCDGPTDDPDDNYTNDNNDDNYY